MIDLRHPLAVLSKRLLWASLEAAVAPKLGERLGIPHDLMAAGCRRSQLPWIRRRASASSVATVLRCGCSDGWEGAREHRADTVTKT
jgi:hypothetical protein